MNATPTDTLDHNAVSAKETKPSLWAKLISKFSVSYWIAGYCFLITLPLAFSLTQNMDSKGIYLSLIGVVNLIAGMAFFVQFPLVARYKRAPLFSNIDKSVSQHKKIGQWLGLVFLLHPLLILAPRLLQSQTEALDVVLNVLTQPQMLTGVIAYVAMIAWVLMSIFKERLPLSYQMWRLQHTIGFIAIAIFVTLHLTTVGSHGQFQSLFNVWWWGLCAVAVVGSAYNYLMKPMSLAKTPFELTSIEKISDSDWEIELEAPHADFDFKAGQFVWLSTSKANDIDYHPFSIASCRSELPKVRFIIRELGDFTRSLGQLNSGQAVYVDGPYGELTLEKTAHAKGITLIAGGAGIGPMVGLLKQLAENGDTRPIRLIYGNRHWDQMVMVNELQRLERRMPNFRLFTVSEQAATKASYCGRIDLFAIGSSVDMESIPDWAVYACGPAPMIDAVAQHTKALGIKPKSVHFEQLSF
ncbi:ferredoxin reductase family protein [Vibrio ulleungensis]|uniref:Ferredoxin reductase family protein n=1 Tax=Vibrio ulleungensis TaxID=2807619 RepID=A0ABS2HEK4_9VIBR|nr:ferredoxin reductase family protein [Vibrio ulleungensis]MBM7035516.1 ferredoxin reductase family protein [Vibrio ulleungensis]